MNWFYRIRVGLLFGTPSTWPAPKFEATVATNGLELRMAVAAGRSLYQLVHTLGCI
jgi:hypothetical protein